MARKKFMHIIYFAFGGFCPLEGRNMIYYFVMCMLSKKTSVEKQKGFSVYQYLNHFIVKLHSSQNFDGNKMPCYLFCYILLLLVFLENKLSYLKYEGHSYTSKQCYLYVCAVVGTLNQNPDISFQLVLVTVKFIKNKIYVVV